jgi:hypothetical protein
VLYDKFGGIEVYSATHYTSRRAFVVDGGSVKDEIIQKLQALLCKPPIEDEPRVVYFLTQIRKVFERDKNSLVSAPTLRFYCNLALHTELSDKRTVQPFLDEVDPILTLQGNHDQETQERFNRLLTLQAFREELREFLRLNDIETTFCDNEAYWNAFLRAYSSVVENCEIVVPEPRPPQGPLNLSVRSVSISPVKRDIRLAANRPYPMDWAITYVNGQDGRLSLSEHGLLGAVVDIR